MWSSYIFSLIPTLVYPGQGLGNKGIILFRFILLHAYITVKVKVNYLFQSVGLSVGSSVSAINDGGLVGGHTHSAPMVDLAHSWRPGEWRPCPGAHSEEGLRRERTPPGEPARILTWMRVVSLRHSFFSNGALPVQG